MKRKIHTSQIKDSIIDLIYKSNFELLPEVKNKFSEMLSKEENPLAKESLQILLENSNIAEKEKLSLCQDCGVVIIFLEIGQDVSLEGNHIEDEINDGVETAYKNYYLRKSIVDDPLNRKNNNKNIPAFIHSDIVQGDKIKITVYLKGGGSENMTSLKMFKPTDSVDEIIDYVVASVAEAGPNPCPPIFLGIGIGGTADLALLNSKKAVTRGIDSKHPDQFYNKLENKIFERINKINIGPQGFGGVSTCGCVCIKEAPTHIATLPVAININCHALRYRTAII